MSTENNNNSNENKVGQNEGNNNSKPQDNIDIKNLPSYEYFQRTVQKEIQQGLLNLYNAKPSNPIKFLGEYLLEKSKSYNPWISEN